MQPSENTPFPSVGAVGSGGGTKFRWNRRPQGGASGTAMVFAIKMDRLLAYAFCLYLPSCSACSANVMPGLSHHLVTMRTELWSKRKSWTAVLDFWHLDSLFHEKKTKNPHLFKLPLLGFFYVALKGREVKNCHPPPRRPFNQHLRLIVAQVKSSSLSPSSHPGPISCIGLWATCTQTMVIPCFHMLPYWSWFSSSLPCCSF